MKVRHHFQIDNVTDFVDYKRRSESSKFCHDGFAEWLFEEIVLDGGEDDSTGDSDFGFATLLGKRILFGHTSGMVTLSRFRSKEEARTSFEEFEQGYVEYYGEEAYEA